MKQIKIILVLLLLITLVFPTLSFTSKSKLPTTVIKLYDVSFSTQITINQLLSIDPRELNDQGYWSNGNVGTHGCSDFLKAIAYNSAELTFQQAIQVVRNYYKTNGTLPEDGGIISGSWGIHSFTIIIWRV